MLTRVAATTVCSDATLSCNDRRCIVGVLLERSGIVEQAAPTRLEYANLFDYFDPSGLCGASRFVFGGRAQRARNGFGLPADRCRFDFGLGDHVARTNIGVVEHARGFCLGFGHQSRRLFLRLGDGCVGGALREHERAPQDVFGFAATRGSQRARFGTLGAFDRLHQATLQLGDRFGPALLVVLYLFFVVPAERFVERRLTNELRRNVHRAIVPPPRCEPRDTEISGAPRRGQGQEPCSYEPCFQDPGRSESRRRSSGETSTFAGINKYTPLVIFSI